MKFNQSMLFRLALGFALAVIALPLFATTAAVVDRRPSGVAAREWVASHADNLPSTLAELSAYPIPYRRAIFVALSPQVKAELWRAQITEFLGTAALTASQKEFVNRTLALLTEENFRRPGDASNPLAGICREIPQLFSKEEAAPFGTLGSVRSETKAGIEATWLNLVYQLQQTYVVRAARGADSYPDCSCSVDSACSCGSCHSDACYTSDDGCGCLWWWMCNGLCSVSPAEVQAATPEVLPRAATR